MTRDRSEDILLRIASAMVDDEAVDWEREASADPDLKRRVHNLRLVQSISDAHHAVRRESVDLTRTDDAPAAGRTWGKLQLLQNLGGGAFGDVYRATDPDLGCDVALKLPASDLLAHADGGERFLNEARRLAKVRHPNVLRVLGAERHDGRVGIWTELIEGQTLEERLRTGGRLSAEEATAIGIDLCRALAAVHTAGLVHRDVKTSNVVREEGGRVVLLDFSAAAERVAVEGAGETDAPLSGTPRFMAPELFRGIPASVQSDIFSLGVLLYRLVTLAYPIEASTLQELAERHQGGQVTPLRDKRPDLPGPFVQVIERALSANPEQRYPSAGATERALLDTISPGSYVTQPAPRRGSYWLMAAAAACAVLLAGIAWWLVPQGLAVDASFYSLETDGSTRHLAAGSQLQVDDRVNLEIELSRKAFVYVINKDLESRTHLLFPLPGLDRSNPIAAHERVALPGSVKGVQNYWIVDSPGEIETFLVIVSTRPNTEVERLIDSLPLAAASTEVEPDRIMRGLGSLGSAPLGAADDPSFTAELADQLTALASSRSGLWFRQYHFRSPRP